MRLPESFERKLGGRRARFPAEDCGGIPGYEDCIADQPTDEIDAPEELREWMGDWHPERLNLAAAKREFDL